MTPKHRKIINFVRAHQIKHDISPSVREIQRAIGCKSSGQISDALNRMEEDGVIRRTPNKPRSIEIVVSNDNQDPWVQIGKAALSLLNAVKMEDINDVGEGTVTVDAIALGNLNEAVAEAMETHHG